MNNHCSENNTVFLLIPVTIPGYVSESQYLTIRKLDSKISGYENVEHFQNEDILLMRSGSDQYMGDKWWFSELEFLRNENNNITGFRLNADGDHVKRLLFVRK